MGYSLDISRLGSRRGRRTPRSEPRPQTQLLAGDIKGVPLPLRLPDCPRLCSLLVPASDHPCMCSSSFRGGSLFLLELVPRPRGGCTPFGSSSSLLPFVFV